MPNQISRRVDWDGNIVAHKLRNMRLVEPKSFFANERTFLHYTKHGIFVLFLIHFLPQMGNEVLHDFFIQRARRIGDGLQSNSLTYRRVHSRI